MARWCPGPNEHLAWAASPPAGAKHTIITRDGVEVGYLRWQRVGRDILDGLGLHEIPANSVDADFLPAELIYSGKGTVVVALRLLIDLLRQDPTVPKIGLTNEVANLRAHRAFERAGFHKARQYVPPTSGPCYRMLYDLRA